MDAITNRPVPNSGHETKQVERAVRTPFETFGKHTVALLFADEDDSRLVTPYSKPRAAYVVSGVVISVLRDWYILTARHCLTDIRKRLRGFDRKIIACRIYDCLAPSSPHDKPIPFDFDAAKKILLGNDENEFDAAVVPVRGNTRELLRANGILPLDQAAWGTPTVKCNEYWLFGVPAVSFDIHRTNADGSVLPKAFSALAMRVTRLDVRPNEFTKRKVPSFYGQLTGEWKDRYGQPMTPDIAGMSGGPLFGRSRMPDGSHRYWLIGIQSRWLRNSERIEVVSATAVGNTIAYAIRQNWREVQTDVA